MSDAERFFVVRKAFDNGCCAIMSLHLSEIGVVGFYVFEVPARSCDGMNLSPLAKASAGMRLLTSK